MDNNAKAAWDGLADAADALRDAAKKYAETGLQSAKEEMASWAKTVDRIRWHALQDYVITHTKAPETLKVSFAGKETVAEVFARRAPDNLYLVIPFGDDVLLSKASQAGDGEMGACKPTTWIRVGINDPASIVDEAITDYLRWHSLPHDLLNILRWRYFSDKTRWDQIEVLI